jgi:bidirectional [NiFe] hydrogenase diaphorase subunit
MTPEKLDEIREQEHDRQSAYAHRINVCVAASCQSRQAEEIVESLNDVIKQNQAEDRCAVRCVGCMGLCSRGPLVEVDHPAQAIENKTDASVMYQSIQPKDAPELVRATLDNKTLANRVCPSDLPYFTRQQRIVLENSGKIDPQRVEDYLLAEGYRAFTKALTEMSPSEVIQEVTTSGLRGRGGAGFPTGLKWDTVAKSEGDNKYVVCNADEGDPGAFMDRAVLESDPHRVIEGMLLAGYAVGANYGYIYVRSEYPLAVQRVKEALRHAKRIGMLGTNLCETPFSFDIELRLGAGAFVCGEETSLIASIEGRRGTPRPRPPFPASYGIWGKPTLINNVETLANIPWIIRHGGVAMAAIGTEKSKGTKVFALAGKLVNNGLIEVPMGITLREIIFDLGGGVPDGHAFKAVQTGGPSGGCLPEEQLDIPVDYESLMQAGSIMGSGGMVVMDDTSNMVDVARFFMEFCKDESCGKCVPCRVGTSVMLDLLEKICEGRATAQELDLLRELCDTIKNTSLCGLGQTAPNPVLSTLRYFENEYTANLFRPKGDGLPLLVLQHV